MLLLLYKSLLVTYYTCILLKHTLRLYNRDGNLYITHIKTSIT